MKKYCKACQQEKEITTSGACWECSTAPAVMTFVNGKPFSTLHKMEAKLCDVEVRITLENDIIKLAIGAFSIEYSIDKGLTEDEKAAYFQQAILVVKYKSQNAQV